MSKRGYLIFANNNEQVDYGLIALINALMIKANASEKAVALVSDESTVRYLQETRGEDLVKRAFDHIILQPLPRDFRQDRRFNDTLSTTKVLPWNNLTRIKAFDLTPFDETIIIDGDYLVCNSNLDLAWGTPQDILINRKALTLEHKKPSLSEQYVEPFSIPLYWATALYFRKSDHSAMLFDIAKHVHDNYDFYSLAYRFKGEQFRNDFAFSIAAHMLNGFVGRDEIESFPVDTILTSFDCDELVDVPARNELVFLVNDTTNRWRFTLSRMKNLNVHVMNKFSITRLADKFIEVYADQ